MRKWLIATTICCFYLVGCGDVQNAAEAYKKMKELEKENQQLRNELDKYKNASKTMYDS